MVVVLIVSEIDQNSTIKDVICVVSGYGAFFPEMMFWFAGGTFSIDQ